MAKTKKKDKNIDFFDYPNKVINGEIVACRYVKLACKRFLDDCKSNDYDFKEEKVYRFLKFSKLFKHYKGGFNGQKVEWQPWQIFIFANIFGLYKKNTNVRKYKEAYIEVARKQGKSFLASIIGLYMLIADGESGSEVGILANSRDQANLLFQTAQTLSRQIDNKSEIVKILRSEITFAHTNSRLKVYAADATKLDGLNQHCSIIDEYHEAKDTKLKDVMQSSMAMRQSPLLMVITTAGFNLESPCYQQRNYCVEVLEKTKRDDSIFAAIYELDEDDDFTDKNNWVKCSPNLDVTVPQQFMEDQVTRAMNNPSEYSGILTKTFNKWLQTSAVTWLSNDLVVKQSKHIDLKHLDKFGITPSEYYCYAGIDLASVSDLTCINFLFTNGTKFYAKNLYYLPETALRDSTNRELYREWRRQGYLTVTAGNVTDYDFVLADLKKQYDNYQIQEVSYDDWNSTQFVIKATEEGLPMKPFAQNIHNFNRPTKEFERLLKKGTFYIDKNPINKFCLNNSVLKSDFNDNVRPIKLSSENKIDGTIAILQSLGTYLQNPIYKAEVGGFTF